MEARVTALETKWDAVVPTLATKSDVSDLKADVHVGFSDMVKWIVATAFTGIAATVVIMTFVLNNAVPSKQPSSQQPTVVVIPQSSTGVANQPAPASR